MTFNPAHARTIAVIIAVKDGAQWIRRSVTSALAQPEAGQVIVVDDGSSDDTAALALACDDGTGRLMVERLPVNRGPSAARNHALDRVATPLLAILDADDFLLPGRFEAMLAQGGADWDLLADDLILVPDCLLAKAGGALPQEVTRPLADPGSALGLLSATAFVEGNISRPERSRRELGFLKPIMRRDFLERHRLRYAEDVRLGEDYLLYLEALIAGARFRLVGACGYVAVERSASLSGAHGAADHGRMIAADTALLARTGGMPDLQRALRAHRAMVQRKLDHCLILEISRNQGRLIALLHLIRVPGSAWAILGATLRGRVGTVEQKSEPGVQLLIGPAGLR
jgi:succinoglycan biosynthesis protein ExoU